MSHNEMITLHCGQAGLQMGHALWESLAAENDITCHGLSNNSRQFEESTSVFFHQVPSEQYVPRTVFMDTEPTVMDEIRMGCYRELFHPESLIAGNEDAANNFARGYYTLGHHMTYECLNRIRYIVESCDNFGGFFSFQGSGGGTGSGLHASIMENIYSEFAHKSYVHSTILPGSEKLSDAIVEPYNTTLAIAHSSESVWNDLKFLISNESLYNICTKQLCIQRPTYANINRLIAPVASSLTTPFRTNGPKAGHLNELFVNLVPYPQMSYPTLSYAPFQCSQIREHESMSTLNLIHDIFCSSHSLLDLDFEKSHIISTVLAFRGNNNHIDIVKSLDKVKRDKHFKFVTWCPTGFKVMHNPMPAIHTFSDQPDKSVLMICNHSEIGKVLTSISYRFMHLFQRHSFVHWYLGEGMEEEELRHSYIELLNIITDYNCSLDSEQSLNIPHPVLEHKDTNATTTIDTQVLYTTTKYFGPQNPYAELKSYIPNKFHILKETDDVRTAEPTTKPQVNCKIVANDEQDTSGTSLNTSKTISQKETTTRLKLREINTEVARPSIKNSGGESRPPPPPPPLPVNMIPLEHHKESTYSVNSKTKEVMLKNLNLSEDLKNKLMRKRDDAS